MRGTLVLGLVLSLSAGPAFAKKRKSTHHAKSAPAPAAAEVAPAPAPAPVVQEAAAPHIVVRPPRFGPRKGRWQIFLTAPPIATQNYAGGFYEPRGFAVNLGSTGGTGFTQIGFGLNGGAGYAYSDLLELGGAVGLDVGNISGGGTSFSAYQFLFEPLVKLNLGSRWHWGQHWNPFVFAGMPIGFGGTSAASGFVFGGELAAGAEYMFFDHFGATLFVPLDFVLQTGSPSTFVFSFGIEYGITVYF